MTDTPMVALHENDVPAWSGYDIAVNDVVGAVERLRRTSIQTATRTSVATLVIVTRNVDELDDADTVIEHLGTRHPARIITLLAPPEVAREADRIDADVVMHAGEAAGHAIWSDEIRLRVSGGPSRHPASLLRPLLLSDLPVVVWYVRGLPNAEDPLLKLADAVLVDTKFATSENEGEPAMHKAFAEITTLSRRHTMLDLSWIRLNTWRRLLATRFQGEVFGPMLQNVKSIEIHGKLGPRTLLGGWLASRLSLPRSALHLYDARHVSVKITAEHDGRYGEFQVERLPGQRVVRATAQIDGGPSTDELLTIPSGALPLALADSLKRIERDKIYEMSIKTIGAWK